MGLWFSHRKRGGLLYLYGSIRLSLYVVRRSPHQSVHKPSRSSQSLSALSVTLGPFFQGGLCEAFQCLNLQDKLLVLSHTLPHTNLSPPPPPLSLFFFFSRADSWSAKRSAELRICEYETNVDVRHKGQIVVFTEKRGLS